MTARNAAAERSAAVWLTVVAAFILLAGVAVVAQQTWGGATTADEPAGQEVTDPATEGADVEPVDPDPEDAVDPAEADDAATTPAEDPAPEDGDASPDEAGDAEAAEAAAGAALWGRWFRITEIRDGDGTADPVGDEPYLVGFAQEEDAAPERGALRWRGPCNTFGAEVAVAPEQLLVGEVGGTAAGCDDALQEQDAVVTRLLAESPEWTLADGQLVLRSQDRALVLVEDPDAAPPPEA